jgi:ribose transport system permease protein
MALAVQEFSIPIAIGMAIGAGAMIGLASGFLIGYLGLAAFVVTLGMMAIGRSLAYILSGQTAISNIPPELSNIVYTTLFGVPANVVFLLALYALAWAYLTYTKGGRTIRVWRGSGCNFGRMRGCLRVALCPQAMAAATV